MATLACLLFIVGINSVWGQYASSAGRGQYAYSASPMGGGYQGGGGGGGYGGGGGCAVIIPDKVKGGKNHICIPWKVVDHYMYEAIWTLDLESKLMEQIGKETGDTVTALAPGDYVENPENKYLGRLGEVLTLVTSNLQERYKLDKRAINEFVPKIDTTRTHIYKYCPVYLSQWNCIISKYRSFDGQCNNLQYPWYGMSKTPYKRFLSPAYADLVKEPRHSMYTGADLDLPSARSLSMYVHEDKKRCDMTTNMMHVWFGQMFNHDMSRKSGSKAMSCCDDGPTGDMNNEMCYPIKLDTDDEHYMEKSIYCMSFTRSQCGVPAYCKLGPMEQLNEQTGLIDGSAWYGPDKAATDKFRKGTGGLLIVSDVSPKKDLLPGKDCDQVSGSDNKCNADAGDNRVAESHGLIMVTTLWWRLHNLIAGKLEDMHVSWNDDQLFLEARRITVAIFQHVIYNEWLTLFYGMENSKKYDILPGAGYFNGYNSKVDPQISNVVSTAVLRACHTNVHGVIEYKDEHGEIVGTDDLSDTIMTPMDHHIDELIMGSTLQCAHASGPSMTEELRGNLFKKNGVGVDLAAINVQRGRDHGLPSYNKWRKWCGLKPITDWNQLYEVFVDPRSVDIMKKLYLGVDDIDIWVATVAEKALPGSYVGPTGACIMARGMREAKIGDRFWYENGGMENSFTPGQLAAIKNVRWSSMLCELSDDIYQVQPWAFALPGQGNELTGCNYIKSMFPIDISEWMDEPEPEVSERYCTTNCDEAVVGGGGSGGGGGFGGGFGGGGGYF